jgi:hypothetical protein
MSLPDDNEPCNAAFQRTVTRGTWLLFAAIVIDFAAISFVPRPFKVLAGLGGGFIICASALGFAFWVMSRSPLTNQMRPAARRYTRRFLPAMLLYVAVFEAATWIYLHIHPTGLLAVLTALAPSIPVLFAIRAMLLLLREETDEYLRARGMEVWALATVLVLGLCTVWGFLDQFEVLPHLPLWAVFPLWACCILPAQIIVNKRHS